MIGPTVRSGTSPRPRVPVTTYRVQSQPKVLDVPQIEGLGGKVLKPPKQHRDGSYSFYFSDPDGNIIQALYEPRISQLEWVKAKR